MMIKYLLLALFVLPFTSAPKIEAGSTSLMNYSISIPLDDHPNVNDEIFQVVENMPRFPGCEDIPDLDERRACASKELLLYVYSNIRYPPALREQRIQGTVVVRFVVEKDGTVSDPCILRTIGEDASEEVERVINLMNTNQLRWSPGTQRNKPVRVYFNLPVKFWLEPDSSGVVRDTSINVNNCGRSSEGSTDESTPISELKAFPNPTGGALTIDFNASSNLCGNYSIIGVEGRTNWEGILNVREGNNRIELPTQGLHRGFHVLLLQDEKGDILKTYKFVKL